MDKVNNLMMRKNRSPWVVVGIEGPEQAVRKRIEELQQIRQQVTIRGISAPYTVMEKIRDKLIEIYGMDPAEFSSPSRAAELVYVRQLFSYFYVQVYLGLPVHSRDRKPALLDVADLLKRDDHATIIHSIETFQQRLDSDSPLPRGLQHLNRHTKEDYNHTLSILQKCL